MVSGGAACSAHPTCNRRNRLVTRQGYDHRVNEGIRLDRLTILGFLWALQALVQKLRTNGLELWFYDNDLLGWLQLASIVAVLLNPRSLYLLLSLLVLSVVELSVRMPINSVHITLEYLFSSLLLLGIVLALIQLPRPETPGRTETVDHREAIFDYIAPFVRISLIIFYAFVVIQKLNWDFLDYTVSCAPHLYEKLSGRIGIALPTAPWATNSVIAMTLAAEATIPALFLFRRTWKAGVLVGVAFHLVLGFASPTGIKGFTTLLYALFLFFTPRDFAVRVGDQLTKLADALGVRERSVGARLVALGAVCALIAALLGTIESHNKLYKLLFEFLFWIPSMAVVVFAYFTALPMSQVDEKGSGIAGLRTLLWITPLLVFFIGINPYIGLRTGGAWSMFSNLRTEQGYNNHLFLPNSFRVAGYQDDLVEVKRFKTTTKRKKAYEGRVLPYFRLLRSMEREEGDFVVKFVRNGERYKVSRVDGKLSDPEVAADMASSSDLEKWYLVFRRIDTGEKQPCVH